ncbi:MAG TPA: PspC domain-containing protein [Pirellulales bacterium]|nr:PspC domain-containing protein [Pirellulales bacterium]
MKRSASDRVIAGVCGAIAQRLVWRSWVVRVLAVVLALHFGLGLLVYLFLWIAWPSE